MAIIGISGYSGAGKDTVGRIIQYLNCYNVGSVPVQEAVHAEHDWWMEEQSGWEIKKFAGKLKQIASILTGIPIQKFEDQEFKKKTLGPEWSRRELYESKAPWIAVGEYIEIPMTVRELLQKLGTEGLRTGLHENVWLNALYADYKEEYVGPDPEGEDIYSLPNWIITDCRFPNEAQSIKDRDGIIIRVERPGLTQINDHPSEHSLDSWSFDYKIINDGDLDKLTVQVRNILEKENLLKHA
jgi:hypothetical protein